MVLSSFLDRMSKRPGEMPNEQVSPKSKPRRGRSTKKKGWITSDEKVGGNEEKRGNAAW